MDFSSPLSSIKLLRYQIRPLREASHIEINNVQMIINQLDRSLKETSDSKIPLEDIQLINDQTDCSFEEARIALSNNKGDVVESVLKLLE